MVVGGLNLANSQKIVNRQNSIPIHVLTDITVYLTYIRWLAA